jgi:hypothetical protein
MMIMALQMIKIGEAASIAEKTIGIFSMARLISMTFFTVITVVDLDLIRAVMAVVVVVERVKILRKK